jgi:hypothetical protein
MIKNLVEGLLETEGDKQVKIEIDAKDNGDNFKNNEEITERLIYDGSDSQNQFDHELHNCKNEENLNTSYDNQDQETSCTFDNQSPRMKFKDGFVHSKFREGNTNQNFNNLNKLNKNWKFSYYQNFCNKVSSTYSYLIPIAYFITSMTVLFFLIFLYFCKTHKNKENYSKYFYLSNFPSFYKLYKI